MLNYVLNPKFDKDSAFFNKYSARKYMKAAVFVREWARRVWPQQFKGKAPIGNELMAAHGGVVDVAEMEEPGDYE